MNINNEIEIPLGMMTTWINSLINVIKQCGSFEVCEVDISYFLEKYSKIDFSLNNFDISKTPMLKPFLFIYNPIILISVSKN